MINRFSVPLLSESTIHLANVASGKFDGFWVSRLNIWDIAAGIILIKEAGGVCLNIEGKEFNPLKDEVLVASSAAISNQLLKNLQIFT